MRLDKFLKTSRVFKRRTVAKEIALHQKISVNGRLAKPSTNVDKGDVVTISYRDKELSFRILDVAMHASKDEAGGMYEVISEN
ncbi:MAG TPA: RNA-binding S4 domain-containing protein [Bacillota bacterium]|nr:RNA-binding S4 domain-containing protein [Bacillota bacterium]HPF42317.1 RNA-binding S4 domain-containing protein [Bacillota bacterium]HPJ86185.1 RNA-binding S4 domain-containing protein [Bacillota bacterium]HPQ61878.1 RNA-binding S4 domain-containing protein [Bacillota bacterium]